ncbi:MAG: S-ribosylhomocysteine lyase [Oscillospiraceae bacterium]|jgi:S-ribosylhomocysteine lyase|nr:S-ribosylhomocysteine lyase [Oscillospiraceae bacterium]
MEKIASFCVDHDKLKKGMYISRVDRDIVTYDIRMVVPNCGVYLDNPAIHSFEHLFATYARNSRYTDNVVYVGPMGCRTGFYFLTRNLPHQAALDLFRETLDFVLGFEGVIPGAEFSRECGNYLDHDLEGAKRIAADMKEVLKDWTVELMDYDVHM